jgi:PKD repeat protein
MNALNKKITPALLAILILFGLKTDLKAQRLDISGIGSYVRVGNLVTLGIDRIDHYINPFYYQSGTLYLQLWTCLTPYNGLQTSLGYKVAEATLDPLSAGYYYSNVSRTVPFFAPPNGTYYMVMVLAESDGYQPLTMDWFNFSNTETFGYIPPPPPPVVTPPSIISQPSNLNVTAGGGATFSVNANGTSPSYQWYKNGSPISGATASSYTIPSAQASDAGNYTVTVLNSAGSVSSNAAILTVNTQPPPPPVVTPPSITSDLSTVSVPKGKLIPRFTITTNFGAKTFAAKGLPKGLKLNTKNGVISGKPTKAGTYTVTLTARKMKGKKVEQQATATKVVIVY